MSILIKLWLQCEMCTKQQIQTNFSKL